MPRQVSRPESPIGEQIKAAQEGAGLTNEELARRLDVSVRLLQKWRAGTVTPGRHSMKALNRVLGADWLEEAA